MSRIDILRTEVIDDPEGVGYEGMTDQQAADSLNEANIASDRADVTGADLQRQVVATEWAALSASDRALWSIIVGLETIPLAIGNIRDQIAEVWAGGTTTRANIVALQSKPISRAEQIEITGTVKPGHVNEARR